MVSVAHVYNRWSKSELNCYIDGQLVSHAEMNWYVNTTEVSRHRGGQVGQREGRGRAGGRAGGGQV